MGMPEASMVWVLNQTPPLEIFIVLPEPVSAIR
jgi:hypothetical protein